MSYVIVKLFYLVPEPSLSIDVLSSVDNFYMITLSFYNYVTFSTFHISISGWVILNRCIWSSILSPFPLFLQDLPPFIVLLKSKELGRLFFRRNFIWKRWFIISEVTFGIDFTFTWLYSLFCFLFSVKKEVVWSSSYCCIFQKWQL